LLWRKLEEEVPFELRGVGRTEVIKKMEMIEKVKKKVFMVMW